MPQVVQLSCETCGVRFEREIKYIRARERAGDTVRFCSRACANRSERRIQARKVPPVTIECAKCGKPFIRHLSKIRHRARTHGTVNLFCSRACAGSSPARLAELSMGHVRDRMTRVPDLRDSLRGYIAGMIDGEGSFGSFLPKGADYPNVHFKVSSTNIEVLEFLQGATKAGTVRCIFDGSDTRRPQYEWQVGARGEILAILRAVQPLMIIKREQAAKILEYCERRAQGLPINQHDRDLPGAIKALNRRGSPKFQQAA